MCSIVIINMHQTVCNSNYSIMVECRFSVPCTTKNKFISISSSSFIIILHTVICDHYGRLDLLAFWVWLRIDRRAAAPDVGYIKWRHMPAQSAARIGITEPYLFTDMRFFFIMPGDDSPSTRDLQLHWNPNQSCVKTGN